MCRFCTQFNAEHGIAVMVVTSLNTWVVVCTTQVLKETAKNNSTL